jgi:ATP-dependent Clp protease ATP-binding subunit ClpA
MLQAGQTVRNRDRRVPFGMAESYDFTTDIRRVLRRARDNALEHGDHAVEPVHLLYGLAALTTSRGTAALIALGADLRDLQLLAGGPIESESATAAPARRSVIARLLRRAPPVVAPPPTDIPYSARTNRVLQLTLAEFQRRGDPDCDTDHLLLGMLALHDDRATALLLSAGVDLDRARTAVARLRNTTS